MSCIGRWRTGPLKLTAHSVAPVGRRRGVTDDEDAGCARSNSRSSAHCWLAAHRQRRIELDLDRHAVGCRGCPACPESGSGRRQSSCRAATGKPLSGFAATVSSTSPGLALRREHRAGVGAGRHARRCRESPPAGRAARGSHRAPGIGALHTVTLLPPPCGTSAMLSTRTPIVAQSSEEASLMHQRHRHRRVLAEVEPAAAGTAAPAAAGANAAVRPAKTALLIRASQHNAVHSQFPCSRPGRVMRLCDPIANEAGIG